MRELDPEKDLQFGNRGSKSTTRATQDIEVTIVKDTGKALLIRVESPDDSSKTKEVWIPRSCVNVIRPNDGGGKFKTILNVDTWILERNGVI